MNWKKEAADLLRDYSCLKASLEGIQEELKYLESSAVAVRSAAADSSPTKGGGSGREDMLLNNIVLREELKQNLQEARRKVARIDKGLAALTREERDILDRFYVIGERGAAERIALELSVDIKTVYHRKNNALRHFTLAMYGRTEV